MPLLVVCTVNARFPLNMGLTMSVVTIHGSPARLLMWINSVFPFFLLAETLNAPSMRKPEKQTSFQTSGSAKYGVSLPNFVLTYHVYIVRLIVASR